jgi:hypothetical protein
MGWTAEELWFDSQQGQQIFHLSKTSGLTQVFTQPRVQWKTDSFPLGVAARA